MKSKKKLDNMEEKEIKSRKNDPWEDEEKKSRKDIALWALKHGNNVFTIVQLGCNFAR